jgi:hypothetical protein
MMSSRTQISRTVPTHFLELKGGERYAYRRFGSGSGLPLLLLQHFTGTLDNWDPALTDALAGERELILFDNAGLGHSSGAVPTSMSGMAKHAATFLDRTPDVSRCRAWLAVPVSRVIRAACSRVPLDQFRIGGLLTPSARTALSRR